VAPTPNHPKRGGGMASAEKIEGFDHASTGRDGRSTEPNAIDRGRRGRVEPHGEAVKRATAGWPSPAKPFTAGFPRRLAGIPGPKSSSACRWLYVVLRTPGMSAHGNRRTRLGEGHLYRRAAPARKPAMKRGLALRSWTVGSDSTAPKPAAAAMPFGSDFHAIPGRTQTLLHRPVLAVFHWTRALAARAGCRYWLDAHACFCCLGRSIAAHGGTAVPCGCARSLDIN